MEKSLSTIKCPEYFKDAAAKMPELRFMQIIVNFQTVMHDDCYYMENEVFLKKLNEWIDDLLKKSSKI